MVYTPLCLKVGISLGSSLYLKMIVIHFFILGVTFLLAWTVPLSLVALCLVIISAKNDFLAHLK